MKNRYLIGVLTSTVLLAGMVGGQLRGTETILADVPILDPLEPQKEIEPLEGEVKLPETASADASQEDHTSPAQAVEATETSQPELIVVPKEDGQPTEQLPGSSPEPLVMEETVTDWEQLGLNRPRFIPNNPRQGYQKKFITDQFFKDELTLPPETGGSQPEIPSELSRICYVMSGRLIIGRKGRSLY